MSAQAGWGLFFLGIMLYPLILYGIFVFERHVEEEKKRKEEWKKNPLYDFYNRD